MALSTTTSRFAILNDDASDPFEKKKKKTASATAAASAKSGKTSANKKTTPPKKSGTGANKTSNQAVPKSKIATSGSQQQNGPGQSKKKKSTTKDGEQKPKNDPLPNHDSSNLEASQSIDEAKVGQSNGVSTEKTVVTKKKSKGKDNQVEEKPKDMQWEEWKKRDQQFVTGSYESDLEAALIQSKLDYQKDESKADGSKARKSKNKPEAISLSAFNQMLGCGNGPLGLVEPTLPGNNMNGLANLMPAPPGLVPASSQVGQDQEAFLMEQFRRDAQKEIERERRLEAERAILQSRPPVYVPPHRKGKKDQANAKSAMVNANQNILCTNPEHLTLSSLLLEKDQQIAELTLTKTEKENEVAELRTRLDKACVMLGYSQVKDKAQLINENEKLSQLNSELKEEVTNLYSQLEQEKSKNSALAADIRKFEHGRKRTQSHNELK